MTKPDITPEQAKNLDMLAAYLEGLPEDYALFSMETFEEETGCGTVACACGHGPMAGVERKSDEIWDRYADRAFGASHRSNYWYFLFSSDWIYYQPAHYHAADRIHAFLKDGVPDAFSGENPFFAYAQSLEQSND